MLAFLDRADVGQVVLGVFVLASPFSPLFAGRISKKPVNVVRWFALMDAIALVYSATYVAALYSLAGVGAVFPSSTWAVTWATTLACFAFFLWTLVAAIRAHRTSAST